MGISLRSMSTAFLTIILILTLVSQTVVHVDSQSIAPHTISSDTEFLNGWEYRKSHTIEGAIGAGTDYQIRIIVYYGTGSDLGENVYCDELCNIDFSDIRFTDDDGMTLLDYWRETYFESNNATFWVEVRNNLDFDVSIFMYYGNPSCTTTSDGESTFVFFDDFNDGIIDTEKWDVFGPWIESGGVASFSITSTGGSVIQPDLRSLGSWDMRNKSIVSSWRFPEKDMRSEWGVSCANSIGDDHTKLAYFLANNNETHGKFTLYYDVNTSLGYDVYTYSDQLWYKTVFHKTEFVSSPNASMKNQWILNDEVIHTYNDSVFNASLQYIFLGFYVHGHYKVLDPGSLGMEFDYVFLRNEIGDGPAHGEWGEEENLVTTTTTSTTTTTTTSTTTDTTNTTGWDWSELPDLVVFLVAGMGGTIVILIFVIIFVRKGRGL